MVDKNNKSLLKSSTKSNFKIAEEHTFKILNEPHCLFTKDAIFLMEQFTNGSHLTPSEFANQIDLFFTKISRHFIFSSVNKTTINSFSFMYFSYETLQRACHYPTSFEYSFQKCLTIIKKVLSILSKPWPKIDFRHDIWNELIQSCESFNTNFGEFSRINRIELRQLWWYLQTEIKSQINHPDYVYDAIVSNLQELNKLLEFILYNQFGANNQNELLSLFELEWKNNKWYLCAVEECYRLIWFHYLKYNRPPKISLPISDDSAKQLLFSLSIKNTSQVEIYQKKLADIIAFFESKFDLSPLFESSLYIQQSSTNPSDWNNLFDKSINIVNTLKQTPLFNKYNYFFNTIINAISQSETIFIKSQFIIEQLQYFSCFLQYEQIKNILNSDPVAFKKHLVELEESFFMNRATPKTREWAMDSMHPFFAYEEYGLNVLKKMIAKKIIETCLSNINLTKKVIPEIFCWDLAFIKKIQKKCIRAIQIHRIINQTNLYFKKYNISNANLNWNDISHENISLEQIIEVVSKKAQLTPIETYQYEAHILESTADEKEDEISNIKQLLFKFSVGSIYPIENESVFPVCDLYILINHLAITHKGTLKHYYEQINNNFLIDLVFNDSLAIPTTPKFESANQKIRQSRYWINKICEALAAMRMTRHHMISQKTLLSDETSIMAILNTIPLRLAPLFKSFFSVQSYQQPNQKTEKNFHTNLNVIIQQFINDIFSEYKNLFFSQLYTMLKSNNVPQKNKYNYLLHPFWNDFFEFSLVFQTLSLARKNKIIHHLQKTHYLPTSHAEFTQFNQVLNQLSPPPFSLKIASHQMQEPIQMCKKECLAFIRQSMGGTLNTHLTNPIDEHCWIRIKTYFKLIKSKTNQKVN